MHYHALIEQCRSAVQRISYTTIDDNCTPLLQEASRLAKLAHLPSSFGSATTSAAPTTAAPPPSGVVAGGANVIASDSATTAGYSNTDHVVIYTRDFATDRIAELKRRLLIRQRQQQPESRHETRWDKPKAAGGRRRRLQRDADLPSAPPTVPTSGYTLFATQMTLKLRHDHDAERSYSQPVVLSQIASYWKHQLSAAQREHYDATFQALQAMRASQLLEFRATGTYTPSARFVRVQDTGPWVHADAHAQNALERELLAYDTIEFAPRPADQEEDYQRRQLESRERRKLRSKGLLPPLKKKKSAGMSFSANKKRPAASVLTKPRQTTPAVQMTTKRKKI